MKLSKLVKHLKDIKIGDIAFDKSTDNNCSFRYCKVTEISDYIWGDWSKTLEDAKKGKISPAGNYLPGLRNDLVKV